MEKEQVKSKIKETLEKMNCTDIFFPDDSKEHLIMVTFNCREITSFVAEIEGWTYSGIHLDPTKQHQYKIDFVKNT